MKEVLKHILQEKEVPKEVKNRLMESAKAQLLFKDLSHLFSSKIPKSTASIVSTVLLYKKNKKV